MKAFISYSHKESWALERLRIHLAPLRGEGKIAECFDQKIPAGDDIDREVMSQLESCGLFIALVSPDFLASDPCKTELESALERREAGNLQIVPIIVEPCGWQATPLGEIKALPRDGKPVTM